MITPPEAALAHAFDDGARAMHHAVEVEINKTSPVRGSHCGKRGGLKGVGHAGVVDEDIERPQALLGLLDTCLDGFEIRDVKGGGARMASGVGDFCSNGFRAVGVEVIHRHDCSP